MPTLRDRLFQLYWRRQRPLTLGVRGIVTDEEGRVLLLRHTYTPGWHFPGGGVEKNETALTALSRELKEEAQLTMSGTPELISVHSNHKVFPNDHVLVFRVGEWTAEAFIPNGEVKEMRFVDPLDPPDETTGGTRRRLLEVFGAAPVSEHW